MQKFVELFLVRISGRFPEKKNAKRTLGEALEEIAGEVFKGIPGDFSKGILEDF